MLWKRTARPLTLRFGAKSDVGRVRSENQDDYGRFPEMRTERDGDQLFIVADGMGGHEDGGRASRTAIEAAQEAYFAAPERPVEDRLRHALDAANLRVYEQARAGGIPKKMGTTCTALAVKDAEAYLAHVGDSRAYLVRKHGISQLTQDHTLVDALRREGVLTEAEAERHPQRHALVRAIGIDPAVEVDVRRLDPPAAGDAYLLCSDGLARVSNVEIRDVVRAETPQQAAETLVDLANERGGHDNLTVLVVKFE
jgi:PPM family protein phosphatase